MRDISARPGRLYRAILFPPIRTLIGFFWVGGAIGIHIAWNFTQSGIFGVTTSGVDSTGYLEGHLQGPSLLSGGDFGPEASIVAVAVCLAAGLYFIRVAMANGHILRPSWAAPVHRTINLTGP